MKAFKIVVVVLLIYVGIVVLFESFIGYAQPQGEGTLVITTTDAAGISKERVLSRIDSAGQLYVAANHWPRAWFNDLLEHPQVQVKIGEETKDYVAVPVTAEEHTRVDADHPLGPMVRILTGFPPRKFVRLDPASPSP